jgi:hypothetical protein
MATITGRMEISFLTIFVCCCSCCQCWNYVNPDGNLPQHCLSLPYTERVNPDCSIVVVAGQNRRWINGSIPILLVMLTTETVTEPRMTEPRKTKPRKTEPRKTEHRKTEPRMTEPRMTEPRKVPNLEWPKLETD